MWNKRSGSNQKGLTKKSFREWKDKEKNFSHATSARNQGTLSQNVKTLTNQLQEKVLQAKIKEIIDENMGRHGRLIVRRRNIRRKSQPLPYGRHNIKRFKIKSNKEVNLNDLETLKMTYHKLLYNSSMFFKAYQNLRKYLKNLSKCYKQLQWKHAKKVDNHLKVST